jgi:DNA invertase Pin-like site-specific DNA recombinase
MDIEENKINYLGYARVSSKHQNEDRQIEALEEFGIKEDSLFVDKASGKDFEREEYQLLKKVLKRTKNNVLIIKSIDRLGRNYKEIQNEWRELTQEYKTDIVVLDMPILDTRQYKDLLGTFISDLVLQILSFVAEQERLKIKVNQAEVIATAIAKGKKFGRPNLIIPIQFEKEYVLWREGIQTAKTTMNNLNLKRSSFYNVVHKYEEIKI